MSFLYRGGNNGWYVVWWILFLLLLTYSASTCLQHSPNHVPTIISPSVFWCFARIRAVRSQVPFWATRSPMVFEEQLSTSPFLAYQFDRAFNVTETNQSTCFTSTLPQNDLTHISIPSVRSHVPSYFNIGVFFLRGQGYPLDKLSIWLAATWMNCHDTNAEWVV